VPQRFFPRLGPWISEPDKDSGQADPARADVLSDVLFLELRVLKLVSSKKIRTST
jgi:hypothetical protein